MSWQTFKNNIVAFCKNPNGIASIEAVAKKYADEYDACIKRGGIKYLNKIPLTESPNKDAMEQSFVIALKGGLNSTNPYELVTEMGKGVISYWTGASLQNLQPSIPAIGSTVNIASNANYINDVGQWKVSPPIFPTKEHGLIVDSFISAAQFHLTTLKGIINTTSLSVALGSPVPGLINWTGYTIEPADKTISNDIITKIEEIDPSLTMQEEEDLESEVSSRKEAETEEELSGEDYEKAAFDAYFQALELELKSGKKISVDVNLSNEELKEIETQSPDESKCPFGLSIVRAARKDVGLIETGANERLNGKLLYPAGTNMGGQSNPNINKFQQLPTSKDASGKFIYTPGRIDEMIDGVFGQGTNRSLWNSKSYGLEWCGCAVAAWWKSANQQLPPNKGAAWVPAWKPWAETNKLWVNVGAKPPFNSNIKKPKLGAAVIYGPNAKGRLYHIGIVSGIITLKNDKWSITTIEGNTGGPQGLAGRGICCNEKSPSSLIAGFVNPPGCR